MFILFCQFNPSVYISKVPNSVLFELLKISEVGGTLDNVIQIQTENINYSILYNKILQKV